MLHLGSHPALHPVFEVLGYASAYWVYRQVRAHEGDALTEPLRWTVIAAAALGALIGSRLLGLAEQWPTLIAARHSGHLAHVLIASGGKTVVGGLLGAWIAVEIVKRANGIHRRTGDLFALPICVGIAVGRVGCLLAGLPDDTYGTPTRLPWGVDFGDGIARHPVQAYEIFFLAVLAFVITRDRRFAEGTRFRIVLAAYLAWRLVIDFLKPQPLIAGMNVIQWACLAGLLALGLQSIGDRRSPRAERLQRAHA